jgi:hypothetical protein
MPCRSRLGNELELEYAMPIHVPMVDVHTIGAGGGSIASRRCDSGMLRVGPESAGATARADLLRPRRHRADDHRRQPRARPAQPRRSFWPSIPSRDRSTMYARLR